jgi:hypothetical protein
MLASPSVEHTGLAMVHCRAGSAFRLNFQGYLIITFSEFALLAEGFCIPIRSGQNPLPGAVSHDFCKLRFKAWRDFSAC